MSDFDRNNKATGIYWLKDSIKDIKFKITIKPQTSIATLPKFEEFINATDQSDLEKVEIGKAEEYIINWQEKVFSAWEVNNYKDIYNCIRDVDHTYHNMVTAMDYQPRKVFTYVNDDDHLSLSNPEEIRNKNKSINCHSLKCLDLERRIGGTVTDSNSMHQLFQSDDNITIQENQWISMHIIYDDSLYAEDSQLLSKQEHVLVSLYYNAVKNYLMIMPDANDFSTNPYTVIISDGSRYQYGVEMILPESTNAEELAELAKDFDADDLYIEFAIKIPDEVKCDNPLSGRTQLAKAKYLEGMPHWNYGQIVGLELEMDDGLDPPTLKIFFEAISTDWWGRHRTEGYRYLPLSLTPGNQRLELSCSMPQERNKMAADNRRFFVGGCHLIKDLEILTKPQVQDADFTFIDSGSIVVRWSVIKHVQSTIVHSRPDRSGSSSALLQGAEAVLRHYSQARARLAAATKDLDQNG